MPERTYNLGDWVVLDRSIVASGNTYFDDPVVGTIEKIRSKPSDYPVVGVGDLVYDVRGPDTSYQNWPAEALTPLDIPPSTDRETVESWLES